MLGCSVCEHLDRCKLQREIQRINCNLHNASDTTTTTTTVSENLAECLSLMAEQIYETSLSRMNRFQLNMSTDNVQKFSKLQLRKSLSRTLDRMTDTLVVLSSTKKTNHVFTRIFNRFADEGRRNKKMEPTTLPRAH